MAWGTVSDEPLAEVQGPAVETIREPPLDNPHTKQGLKKSGNRLATDIVANVAIGSVAARARRTSSLLDRFSTSTRMRSFNLTNEFLIRLETD